MGILKKEMKMNKIQTVSVDFDVSSDASTPDKTALELSALKVVLGAMFTQFNPDERQTIIDNIEALNLKETQSTLSVLKSIHESAK